MGAADDGVVRTCTGVGHRHAPSRCAPGSASRVGRAAGGARISRGSAQSMRDAAHVRSGSRVGGACDLSVRAAAVSRARCA